MVATAAVGPERLAYGAPRDMLLGLQYIDSSGSMVSAGGRVVKNVAGYDMTRLLTGSLGTLGFITEATWRIGTRPDTCKRISGSGTIDECFAAGLKIVNSNLLAALVTITPEAGLATLTVGFEGLELVVGWTWDAVRNAPPDLVRTYMAMSYQDETFGALREQYDRYERQAIARVIEKVASSGWISSPLAAAKVLDLAVERHTDGDVLTQAVSRRRCGRRSAPGPHPRLAPLRAAIRYRPGQRCRTLWRPVKKVLSKRISSLVPRTVFRRL